MTSKKKIQKPVVKNQYTNASKDKIEKGVKRGDNDAITEALRRAGI
jgi:hypothetical protein